MFALDTKLVFVDKVGLHGCKAEMVSMGMLQNKQPPTSLVRIYNHN